MKVYAFEPGVAKRFGDSNRFVEDMTTTIRANAGDNQVAVAYPLLILNDQGGSVMSVTYGVTNTLRAQMKHHEPIVCYAPTRTNCESYEESSMSATLCTKRHYGAGGDAALVVEETGHKEEPIAFIERAGCEGGVRVSLSPLSPER